MSVADLAVRIVAQVDGFKGSMDSVSGQVDKMGKNLQNVGKGMVSVGKKMTIGITTPVVGLAGSLVKTGIEFKAFKQESKQAFSVLLGSAEAAQVHMDRIMAFAKTTPFAFPDLVSANRKLVSFGMTAQDTEPVMEAIANSVAAMGGGGQEIEELADVFAKITANGKITGQELNRLGDKGINALAIMANKAGVSMEDMRKQISSGAIDSKTAIDWLVDGIMNGTEGIAGQTVAMGGSLEALKDTWGGAMDSLKGAWRNAADEIVSDEMFEKIIEGIRKLTDVIKDLPQLMGPLADTLGEVFISLIDGAVKLVEWFNNLSPGAQQFIVKLGLLAVAAGPVLIAVGKAIAAFTQIVKVAKTVGTVFGFVSKAIGFLASPIGLVVLAAIALAGIVYLVIKNWDKISEFFSDLWDGVKKIFSAAWEGIQNIFFNYTPLGLVIQHWEEITSFFSELWENVKEIFSNAITGIVEFFQNLPQTLAKFFLEDLPYMLGFALGTLVRWIIEAVQWFASLPGQVWEWLLATLEKVAEWAIQTGQKALEAGQAFVENTIQFFRELPGKVWTWLVNTIAKIITWAGNMRQKASQAGREFVNNVISFVKQLPGKVWNWLTNTISKITNFASQAGSNAKNAGRNILNGVVNTIKSLPNKVWNIMKDAGKKVLSVGSTFYDNAKKVASNLWSGFKKGLGIASPSYLERAMDDIADRADLLKDELSSSFGPSLTSNLRAGMANIGAICPPATSSTVLAQRGGPPNNVHHSGTIRVEGVNDQGQLTGIVDVVIERLLQEVRA